MVDLFDLNKIKWIKGNYGLIECYAKIKVPSVSTILSEMVYDPEYEEFIRKMGPERAEQIMKDAANRGTAMHLFIENFINIFYKEKDVSDALSYTQNETPKQLLEQNIPQNKIDEGRDLFYKFYYSEYSNKFSNLIGTELAIYSPTLFYRGKSDVFYKDNLFGYAVTDHKTSSSYIKKGTVKELKYKLQLGAYANALDEMYKDKGLKINKANILLVCTKSDILQDIDLSGSELEDFKEQFKTLCKEYHIKNKTEFLIKNN